MGKQKRFWKENMTDRERNMYQELLDQAKRYMNYKTSPQAFRGHDKYIGELRLFLQHCASEYGMRNIRNISDKHVSSFIEKSKEAEVGVGTIKSGLSAIRKLVSLIPNAKHEISSNIELGYTERRQIRGVDRAWTQPEFEKACNLALDMGRKDVYWALNFARYEGTRIEEITGLTRSQVRDMLKHHSLHLEITKGNIPRNVPERLEIVPIAKDILSAVTDRERIFTFHGRTHEQARNSISDWIRNHREEFMLLYSSDPQYTGQLQIDYEHPDLTFHGLRHSYAREEYYERIGTGMDEKSARLEVAELLGHGRDDVTRVYLVI